MTGVTENQQEDQYDWSRVSKKHQEMSQKFNGDPEPILFCKPLYNYQPFSVSEMENYSSIFNGAVTQSALYFKSIFLLLQRKSMVENRDEGKKAVWKLSQ